MVERVKPKASIERVRPSRPAPEPQPAIRSRATLCVHCKKPYIYPCTDPGAELDCSNYKFLQENKKRKRKK